MAIEAAAGYKAAANDAQARIVLMELCDVSLGGMDQWPSEVQVMAIEQCTGLDVRPAQIEVIERVAPAARIGELRGTPGP